ncbi:hypothetical protein [Pseudobacteroides cellulosolvens]|uniref:GIY-YIG domain-containing protein n=1 Tax=Pseudobacteroides cellulosolvens ATCC 35603 = DSM 2933 TaxID=398512 RepID=A0A0L6JKN2_9FIRM|nr:hypothetical protein [Pseudobacteroides cellulosolvens]KNY26344.1 hypothetical protein Bccel_1606 [Pseudobacteroides cellulosolvens ATCC 35603 = DSM 2933]
MNDKMKVVGNIYCAGVYGMRLKGSQEYIYVGSAIEINDALSRHNYYLKRGLYNNTNKQILQYYFDLEELIFEVIHESEHKKVKEMSFQEKENLHKALSVLEKFYIEMYRSSCCNTQNEVSKHSSNKDMSTTIKRQKVNSGSNNPNSKYKNKIIAEILWLKINGYKPKQIAEFYKDVNKGYISQIGITKWIHLEPIKPEFVEDIV